VYTHSYTNTSENAREKAKKGGVTRKENENDRLEGGGAWYVYYTFSSMQNAYYACYKIQNIRTKCLPVSIPCIFVKRHGMHFGWGGIAHGQINIKNVYIYIYKYFIHMYVYKFPKMFSMHVSRGGVPYGKIKSIVVIAITRDG